MAPIGTDDRGSGYGQYTLAGSRMNPAPTIDGPFASATWGQEMGEEIGLAVGQSSETAGNGRRIRLGAVSPMTAQAQGPVPVMAGTTDQGMR